MTIGGWELITIVRVPQGGEILHRHDAKAVDALLAAIEVYVLTRQTRKDLVSPYGGCIGDDKTEEDDVSAGLMCDL